MCIEQIDDGLQGGLWESGLRFSLEMLEMNVECGMDTMTYRSSF